MAYATINFVNPMTGSMKLAPVGFSWTTLFFGFFPAMLRGHWVGAVVLFLLGLFTLNLSNFVTPFFYNKMYVKYLLGEGYKVKNTSQDPHFLAARLNLPLPMLDGPMIGQGQFQTAS